MLFYARTVYLLLLLSATPFYGSYSFIHLSADGHLDCFRFMAIMNIYLKVFLRQVLLLLLGKRLGWVVRSYVRLITDHSSIFFQRGCVPCHRPSSCIEDCKICQSLCIIIMSVLGSGFAPLLVLFYFNFSLSNEQVMEFKGRLMHLMHGI